MDADLDETDVKDFYQEIEIMKTLRHPNILQFLGAVDEVHIDRYIYIYIYIYIYRCVCTKILNILQCLGTVEKCT